jgi:hypothetical protein
MMQSLDETMNDQELTTYRDGAEDGDSETPRVTVGLNPAKAIGEIKKMLVERTL